MKSSARPFTTFVSPTPNASKVSTNSDTASAVGVAASIFFVLCFARVLRKRQFGANIINRHFSKTLSGNYCHICTSQCQELLGASSLPLFTFGPGFLCGLQVPVLVLQAVVIVACKEWLGCWGRIDRVGWFLLLDQSIFLHLYGNIVLRAEGN